MKGPYKTGQKVRVRADLIEGQMYGKFTCLPSMFECAGSITQIYDDDDSNPPIKTTNGSVFFFADEMLEEVVDE